MAMAKLTLPEIELMSPGHMGCIGCGATHVMRYTLKALGPKTIVNIPACCWAVIPGVFPYTSQRIPFLYNAFETTAATAAGVRAALNAKGVHDVHVVGFAGDGGTADIGIQALSGAAERGDNIIYVCYDNEAYMNTGIQRSSLTPYGAWTTTTPVGKKKQWQHTNKKNMVEIMAAHRIPYAATVAIAFPEDFVAKLQKAATFKGVKYIHALSPCPVGWRYPPEKTVEVARLAVNSCVFPLYEIDDGRYTISRKPTKKVPVKEYYAPQGRFRHLPEDVLGEIQRRVDAEWELLLKKEEETKKTRWL